jgi:hypothetical protein
MSIVAGFPENGVNVFAVRINTNNGIYAIASVAVWRPELM